MEIKNDELKAEVLESKNDDKIDEKNDETKKEEVKKETVKKENVKQEKTSSESPEKNNTSKNSKSGELNKIENNKRVAEQKANYELKQKKVKKRKHKALIFVVIFVILIIIAALFSTIFALINASNDKILKGISIRNISVEGLTMEEATKLLNDKFEYEKTREIELNVNGEVYSIIPEQIETTYNVEEAVNKAYDIGRDGNIIQNNFAILNTFSNTQNLDLEVNYNEKMLEDIIKDISAKIADAVTENTYCIEADELIITKGAAGFTVDLSKAKEKIITSILEGKAESITLETNYEQCPAIDIDKIYEEVHAEPQNATYTKDPFEIIPHKNGIDFNKEEAKKVIAEEKDEYVIELIITEPEIKTNEIGEEAFPDLLGSYSTKFDVSNVSRAKNVRIALEKLNGVVVMPGEVFSYNKTLGKRTEADGYEYAPGYSGGKVVPMLAGGICQVSSTLYDAVVYADLNVVERYNHMFQTHYIAAGRDATVVYGSLDFKFENTRKYPIRIKTTSSNGIADVKIFGVKEEVEYEIEIVPKVINYTSYKVVYENDSSLAAGKEVVSQSGMQGCKTITYKIKKLNGQEISNEVLSTDTYSPMNKIVRRGTKGAQTSAKPAEQPKVEQPVQTETVQETKPQVQQEIKNPATT